jgi:hypothetical protein
MHISEGKVNQTRLIEPLWVKNEFCVATVN